MDEVRATEASERLLEDSWEARSRRASRRELAAEAVAGLVFLACAGPLAVAAISGHSVDVATAGLLVVLSALFSRIEFPVGAGYVVPSYVVLVPMLVLLPPGVVPLLTALALVLGAFGQWVAGRARPERMLFSVPDAWHAVGPAVVLVAAGGDPAYYPAAFLAGCLADMASATLRDAAALGVAPHVQIRVVARAWLVDACLAPIGLLAALAAGGAPERLLLVLPLGGLLAALAHDRSARIEQAQRRLEQAFTDPLTKLGNRRLLAEDLRERFDSLSEDEPVALMVFDLNGFKGYNDTFGHVAGDALLARLGAKLADAVEPDGAAYRLGGDEFCVLLRAGADLDDRLVAASDALTEVGGEFTVGASHGVVLVPAEADTPDHALQLADERMYSAKHGRSSGTRDQARDVLMRSMSYRQPSLHDHSSQVADLSRRIARRLGMDAEEIDVVTRAAELHDLGKVGIPDVILEKSDMLDQSEWEFMRQHTILGERILNAAPALRPVARIVRASHERWDGCGYPDGLAGDAIPVSARIIAVCDAYEAMTTDRPYRRSIGHDAACEELRGEAGRQFDPLVVEHFLDEVAGGAPEPEAAPAETATGRELDEVTAHLRELLRLRRRRSGSLR
ncbi:MAG TPA: HD domain-containing phosphohydrolase [Thermoleophilaceae bacterium]